MPSLVVSEILPVMISPLKALKTTRRNSTDGYQILWSDDGHRSLTLDVHKAVTMSNQAIRDFQKVIHPNAETGLLDDLFSWSGDQEAT